MFILGVSVILLGVVVMIVQYFRSPGFFRGETLTMAAPESLRRR